MLHEIYLDLPVIGDLLEIISVTSVISVFQTFSSHRLCGDSFSIMAGVLRSQTGAKIDAGLAKRIM